MSPKFLVFVVWYVLIAPILCLNRGLIGCYKYNTGRKRGLRYALYHVNPLNKPH